MRLQLAPRLVGYVVVAGGALIAAVALRDPPLAALGVPALLACALGVAFDTAVDPTAIAAAVRVERELLSAGQSTPFTLTLLTDRPIPRCRVSLSCEPGLVPRSALRWLVRLPAGRPVELAGSLHASDPGEYTVGPVHLLTSSWAGLVAKGSSVAHVVRVDVRPVETSLRTLPRGLRVRVPAGDRIARAIGEGIELAEVRPELPGEHARRINWRATARRGTVHVTLRHPEQSTDVVIFADTFDGPSLSRVLTASATAAAGYLLRRDRVGLIAFGGLLDWVEPATGRRQLERVRARLSTTRPFFSYAWKSIDRLPPRALPAGALVVAISPLRDERFTSAIVELRALGHDVIAVEIADEERTPTGGAATLVVSRRLARMEREDLRERLWTRGVSVVPLRPGEPLESVFAALNEVRRRLRPVARH